METNFIFDENILFCHSLSPSLSLTFFFFLEQVFYRSSDLKFALALSKCCFSQLFFFFSFKSWCHVKYLFIYYYFLYEKMSSYNSNSDKCDAFLWNFWTIGLFSLALPRKQKGRWLAFLEDRFVQWRELVSAVISELEKKVTWEAVRYHNLN